MADSMSKAELIVALGKLKAQLDAVDDTTRMLLIALQQQSQTMDTLTRAVKKLTDERDAALAAAKEAEPVLQAVRSDPLIAKKFAAAHFATFDVKDAEGFALREVLYTSDDDPMAQARKFMDAVIKYSEIRRTALKRMPFTDGSH